MEKEYVSVFTVSSLFWCWSMVQLRRRFQLLPLLTRPLAKRSMHWSERPNGPFQLETVSIVASPGVAPLSVSVCLSVCLSLFLPLDSSSLQLTSVDRIVRKREIFWFHDVIDHRQRSQILRRSRDESRKAECRSFFRIPGRHIIMSLSCDKVKRDIVTRFGPSIPLNDFVCLISLCLDFLCERCHLRIFYAWFSAIRK